MTIHRERLYFLATGGTIEKTYDESDGSLQNRGTFIKSLISTRLRLPGLDWDVIPLMSKDSLDMTDEDRKLITASIQKLIKENCPIIVLHGTDTMEISAQYCFENLTSVSVPVIFTGAMRPVGFENSDAIQNITEALAFAKVLEPGVYVSFHNQIFPANKVRKNKSHLTFEPIK